MKITKFGHCCLLVEEGGLRILTDPGNYTEDVGGKVKDLDIILITHEHPDHIHIPAVKELVANNPQAKIITNKGVSKMLEAEGIAYTLLSDGEQMEEKGLSLSGHGTEHAEIYKTWPKVENTGYFIGPRLFYPGDAFTNPGKPVEVLALPAEAPWLKLSEVIDYFLLIKPKVAFPVHDGHGGFSPRIWQRARDIIFTPAGLVFDPFDPGETKEF